jgi:hypothetical protein
MWRTHGVSMMVSCVLMACAPALDWREVRPAGSGATMLFPCKPDNHARKVTLGTQELRLVLHACRAGDSTWALAFADVAEPAHVGPALTELRAAAARNLGASDARILPLKVEGATPNPASQRVQIRGRIADGRLVTEQLAVFAVGTRVFQATALGEALEPDAAETFFASLCVAP